MRKKFNALLKSFQPRQRATFLAASQRESGAWLESFTLSTLWHILDKHKLQISVCLSIFSTIYLVSIAVKNCFDTTKQIWS